MMDDFDLDDGSVNLDDEILQDMQMLGNGSASGSDSASCSPDDGSVALDDPGGSDFDWYQHFEASMLDDEDINNGLGVDPDWVGDPAPGAMSKLREAMAAREEKLSGLREEWGECSALAALASSSVLTAPRTPLDEELAAVTRAHAAELEGVQVDETTRWLLEERAALVEQEKAADAQRAAARAEVAARYKAEAEAAKERAAQREAAEAAEAAEQALRMAQLDARRAEREARRAARARDEQARELAEAEELRRATERREAAELELKIERERVEAQRERAAAAMTAIMLQHATEMIAKRRIGRAALAYLGGDSRARKHSAATQLQAAARGMLARRKAARLMTARDARSALAHALAHGTLVDLEAAVEAAKRAGESGAASHALVEFHNAARTAPHNLQEASAGGCKEEFERALHDARRFRLPTSTISQAEDLFQQRVAMSTTSLQEAGTSASMARAEEVCVEAQRVGVTSPAEARAVLEAVAARDEALVAQLRQVSQSGNSGDLPERDWTELVERATSLGLSAAVAQAKEVRACQRELVASQLAAAATAGTSQETAKLRDRARRLGLGSTIEDAERVLTARRTAAEEAVEVAARGGGRWDVVMAIVELANASSPESFPWQGGPMSAEVQKMAKMKLCERAEAQLELLQLLARDGPLDEARTAAQELLQIDPDLVDKAREAEDVLKSRAKMVAAYLATAVEEARMHLPVVKSRANRCSETSGGAGSIVDTETWVEMVNAAKSLGMEDAVAAVRSAMQTQASEYEARARSVLARAIYSRNEDQLPDASVNMDGVTGCMPSGVQGATAITLLALRACPVPVDPPVRVWPWPALLSSTSAYPEASLEGCEEEQNARDSADVAISHVSSKKLPGVAGANDKATPVSTQLLKSNAGGRDLNRVMRLDLGFESLTSMQGLDQCPNLQVLLMNVNQVSSLEGLEKCTALHTLSLRDNAILHLGELAPLPNLQVLSLDINHITSLQGLKGCRGVRELSVCSNRLTSLSGLEPLISLERLSVSANQIKSLGAHLAGCVHLQHLDVTMNQLSSLGEMSGCPVLESLAASDNAIKKLPWGGLRCPLLQTLWLNRNQLTHLPDLSGLPHLEALYLQENSIASISPLHVCPLLKTLDLSFNRLALLDDVRALEGCARLCVVQVNDNPVAQHPEYVATLLQLLPSLQELDNDPVTSSQRQEQRLYVLARSPHVVVPALREHVHQRPRALCAQQEVLLALKHRLSSHANAGALSQHQAPSTSQQRLRPRAPPAEHPQILGDDVARLWLRATPARPVPAASEGTGVCEASPEDDSGGSWNWVEEADAYWDRATRLYMLTAQRDEVQRTRASMAVLSERATTLSRVRTDTGFGGACATRASRIVAATQCDASAESLKLDELEHQHRRMLQRHAAETVDATSSLNAYRNVLVVNNGYWQDLQQARDAHATKLQSAWRGHCARSKVANLKMLQANKLAHKSAVMVQKVWRGHAVRIGKDLQARKAHYLAACQHRAQVELEAAMAKERREKAAQQALEDSMAPKIQAAWKGHLIRRRIREAQLAAKFMDDDDDDWDMGEVDLQGYLPPAHLRLEEAPALTPAAVPAPATVHPSPAPVILPDSRPTASSTIATGKLNPTIVVPHSRNDNEDINPRGQPSHTTSSSVDQPGPSTSDGMRAGSPPRYASSQAASDDMSVITVASIDEKRAKREERHNQRIAEVMQEWGFKDKASAEAFLKKRQHNDASKIRQKIAAKYKDPVKRLDRIMHKVDETPHVLSSPHHRPPVQRPAYALNRGQVQTLNHLPSAQSSSQHAAASTACNENVTGAMSSLRPSPFHSREGSLSGRSASDTVEFTSQEPNQKLLRRSSEKRPGGVARLAPLVNNFVAFNEQSMQLAVSGHNSRVGASPPGTGRAGRVVSTSGKQLPRRGPAGNPRFS